MYGDPERGNEISIDITDSNNIGFLWQAISRPDNPGVIAEDVLQAIEEIQVSPFETVSAAEVETKRTAPVEPFTYPRNSSFLVSSIRRLFHNKPRKSALSGHSSYFYDPNYQGARVADTTVVFRSPHLPSETEDIWASTAVTPEPVEDNLDSRQVDVHELPNISVIRLVNESLPKDTDTGEGGFLKLGSGLLNRFKEKIKQNRLALGIGAVMLTGSLAFAAFSLDSDDSKVLSQQAEGTFVAPPSTVYNSPVIAMPGQIVKPKLPSIPSSESPQVDDKPATTVTSEVLPIETDPNTIIFEIEQQGSNLSWVVKDKLKHLGIGDHENLDDKTTRVVALIQSKTTQSVNTVFVGNSFSLTKDQVLAT